MKVHLPSSFDDLVGQHYGGSGNGILDPQSLKDLYASYYGQTSKPKQKKKKTTASVTMSISTDDGEVMRQTGFVEYVVQQSTGDCGCCNEYVVHDRSQQYPAPNPAQNQAQSAPAPRSSSTFSIDDDRLDQLLAPQSGNMPAPVTDRSPSRSFSYPEPTPGHVPPPDPIPAPTPAPNPVPPSKGGDPSDDEFFKDLQDIISGNGKFNQDTRKVEPTKPSAPAPPPPMPNADNGQAIFDRIAQSMSYANAYDLGDVELENRFAQFDQMADERQTKPKAKKSSSSDPRPPSVNTTDFLEDMRAIADQSRDASNRIAASMAPGGMPSGMPGGMPGGMPSGMPPGMPSMGMSQSQSANYSRPFFDTGEHAQMGDSSFDGMLHVGPHPGVAFTYGEIIACGDFYSTPEQMMAASITDLTKLKSLIERGVKYYQGGKSNPALNTTDDDWQGPTHGQYLKLAEDNYEHFSPAYYFPTAGFAKSVHKHGTNRSQWERFHKQAIDAAREMFADPANKNTSIFYEWPLIINAFADHFLTDAFSAGHLVNKEEIIALFRQNFYSGSSLNAAGKQFFANVAAAAFQGEVAEKFSALETTDYPVCKWGWCIKWHPNINSVSRFTSLLQQAAEQQPERIANFALKALHDKLNKDGVEVTNSAGSGVWTQYGDAFMSVSKNLPIIKRAVQQSVDNINDPSIMSSAPNYGALFDKVWKYVPVPTSAGRTKILNQINTFTDPNSAIGAAAAAEIVKDSVNAMIKILIDEGKLQRA